MKTKVIKNILICLSVFTNVVLVCTLFLILSSNANGTTKQNEQMEYRLQNGIVYDQLFYGKWKITDCILPNSGLPRSYYTYDENGALTGGNYEMINAIIGEEIVFDTNYAEYSGNKHKYVYGPETYTHALLSAEQKIGWYSASELDLTGNTYSYVYFLLPGHYQVIGFEKHVNEMRIDDLYLLVLKDNETIYASSGVVMYRLERVE